MKLPRLTGGVSFLHSAFFILHSPVTGPGHQRKFCQLMGGDITVQSEAGNGSVFTVTLPAEVRETNK